MVLTFKDLEELHDKTREVIYLVEEKWNIVMKAYEQNKKMDYESLKILSTLNVKIGQMMNCLVIAGQEMLENNEDKNEYNEDEKETLQVNV